MASINIVKGCTIFLARVLVVATKHHPEPAISVTRCKTLNEAHLVADTLFSQNSERVEIYQIKEEHGRPCVNALYKHAR